MLRRKELLVLIVAQIAITLIISAAKPYQQPIRAMAPASNIGFSFP